MILRISNELTANSNFVSLVNASSYMYFQNFRSESTYHETFTIFWLILTPHFASRTAEVCTWRIWLWQSYFDALRSDRRFIEWLIPAYFNLEAIKYNHHLVPSVFINMQSKPRIPATFLSLSSCLAVHNTITVFLAGQLHVRTCTCICVLECMASIIAAFGMHNSFGWRQKRVSH